MARLVAHPEHRRRALPDSAEATATTNGDYAIGLARAFAGALLFALPLLMTMEMWWLGFTMDRSRLILFLIVNFALLIGLAYFVGFERADTLLDCLLDALAACGIGILASAALLGVMAILQPGMGMDELIGKIAVQSVPASFGAVLASGQMAGRDDRSDQDEKERRWGHAGQLFIMAAGAVFLAFNVAPTEEMILIAYRMTPLHGIAIMLLSVLLLHAFVYALGFAGQERPAEGRGRLHTLGLGISGYGIALIVSLYVLWTFGRTDHASADAIVMMAVVLGFPAALGAASARLVI